MARALVQPVTDLIDPAREPDEVRLRYGSGRLSLDLVTTVGERWRRSFERLRSPADLAAWLGGAGLLSSPARVTQGDLLQVRELREAIFRIARAAMDRREPQPADIATLNARAAAPDLAPTFGRLGGGVGRDAPGGALRAAMSTIARDAVELFAGPHAARIRECAAPDCSGLFLDASRAGRRRWCSMAACGNRTKVAAYRTRTRTAAGRREAAGREHGRSRIA
jgi:predicted RNA-binding Zn ribbon-like protein